MKTSKNPKTDGFDGEFKEFQDDQMGLRIVEIEAKNGKMQTFNVSQDGQFALWKIIPSKGGVPEELSGRYTSIGQAEQAIKAYVAKRDGLKLA